VVKSFSAELLALPYRLVLARIGRRPRLFPPIFVSGGRRIRIGDDAHIESFVAMSVGRGGCLEIGSHCELRAFARLEADVGSIVLGNRCSVNPFCVFNGFGGISIGDDVRIASHTVILSSSHRHDDPTVPIHAQGTIPQETVIGNDVWIGAHSVILGGVRIGSHSIVAAGAVVTADVPHYSVVAGVPARVIRSRAETATASQS
jgi:acetyltransferase-like isoleucine patch superfamily enzyme